VLAAITVSVRAAGLIIVHEPDFWRRLPPHFPPPVRPPIVVPPPRPVWAPLEVSFTKADVKVRDQIARATIEQEFYNPNARQLEGTFIFPVPKGAQIDKFTMEINGKPVEAELLAADKARGIYEDIVRKLRDPALLEYAGRDLFKVRIFPIEPNSRKRITLSFTQLLKSDSGLVALALPLNTEKFSAKPIRNVSVKVDLETRRPLKSVYSPSHQVEVRRDGANRAVIGYEASEVKADSDFEVYFSQEDGDVGLSLLAHKTGEGEGFFLLLAAPGAETKNAKVLPKDVVFVLDTSGSMAGAKLTQAKKALAFCVKNLNDQDRFEVLRFATEVEPVFDKLSEASPSNRERAQSFIKDLRPLGGTAIDEALKKSLALRPESGERPFVVVFLTDGRPTIGNTAEDAIVGNVKQATRGNTRVFCFGIGTDVNTHLLDKITEETRAFSQYVLPEEDIEVKVSNFFTKIKEPVLAQPKLDFPEGVRVTKVYPSPLPDLFRGEQLVLVGRYSGHADGAIQLAGSMGGETRKFAFDAKFPDAATDHDFIPRLWATRRVGYLLDEIRLRGENKELKDEVTELARRFGIVTPYTAYLIVEDERQRGVPMTSMTMPQLREERARREAADVYFRFSREKGGDLGVAGARSYQQLKSANAPADAIAAGNVETLRAAPSAAPTSMSANAVGGAGLVVAGKSFAATAAQGMAQQSRFVAGRTFYQNGTQWVDGEVQKLQSTKPVRIQFGSDEYFALLKKHPEARKWLALGSNLQCVIGGTVYEIFE
jgi:Ca-activated chloride channel family protein